MPALSNDATTALLRALRLRVAEAPVLGRAAVRLEQVRSRAWASATFAGARHEIGLRFAGAGAQRAAERFLAGLDAAEFSVRGHILADIAVIAQERDGDAVRVRLEALTVEEG